MPRKFSPEERKRMLERLEHGATYTDLKTEFNIRDSRTLDKQLTQARQEQAVWVAKTEIIKESLRDHLAEVRGLVERWASSLKAPSPPSFSRYPLSAAEEVEHNRLFEGIREHLPFPELWKKYNTFKAKWEDYLTICKQVHQEVLEEAGREWGLQPIQGDERRRGLTSSFSWEIVDWSMKIAEGAVSVDKPQYVAASLGPESNVEYLQCDARVILYSEDDALTYADRHWAMISEWAKSDKIATLVNVLGELRVLAESMQNIVEEALLRRDYILYTCRLCPGQGKPAFRRSKELLQLPVI